MSSFTNFILTHQPASNPNFWRRAYPFFPICGGAAGFGTAIAFDQDPIQGTMTGVVTLGFAGLAFAFLPPVVFWGSAGVMGYINYDYNKRVNRMHKDHMESMSSLIDDRFKTELASKFN